MRVTPSIACRKRFSSFSGSDFSAIMGRGGRGASGKEMDLDLRSPFISSKDFRQRVDLGDFIVGPFPEKQSPPSEIILSQQGAIIKKRNSLSADYADWPEVEVLFIIITFTAFWGQAISKKLSGGRGRGRKGGRESADRTGESPCLKILRAGGSSYSSGNPFQPDGFGYFLHPFDGVFD
jgi:hypothetical protein